MIHNFLNFKHN